VDSLRADLWRWRRQQQRALEVVWPTLCGQITDRLPATRFAARAPSVRPCVYGADRLGKSRNGRGECAGRFLFRHESYDRFRRRDGTRSTSRGETGRPWVDQVQTGDLQDRIGSHDPGGGLFRGPGNSILEGTDPPANEPVRGSRSSFMKGFFEPSFLHGPLPSVHTSRMKRFPRKNTGFTRLRQDAPCGSTGRNGDRRPRRSP
jgi:hypothetical protein